jgi:peptide/nickel transport system permease protein
MFRLVIRRLVGGALVVWTVVSATFLATHLISGDPAEAALSQSLASEDVLQRRREALGLDQPLPAQYMRHIGNLVRLDWGVSWATGEPVRQMIGQQFGPTLSLAVGGTLVGVVFGMTLGVMAAAGRGRWIGRTSRLLAGGGLAVPVMYSGTLLIVVLAIWLDWLPATGQGNVRHLVLPALAVGLNMAGGIGRAVDAGLSTALNRPFILAVRAKGAGRFRVLWHHGMRVGLLPVLDVVAVQFGFLLGGAVVTESVFARQGLGRLLLSSVLNQDLPVLQVLVALSALIYVILNMAADLARAGLDPRVRLRS